MEIDGGRLGASVLRVLSSAACWARPCQNEPGPWGADRDRRTVPKAKINGILISGTFYRSKVTLLV